MAKGTKTGGRNIKPGQVLNPLGAKAHDQDLKRVKRITREEVSQLGSLILENNIVKLTEIADNAKEDPESPHSSLKAVMARVILKAYAKGDAAALNTILDRIVGKIKDEVQVSTTHTPKVIILPSNGRERRSKLDEIKPQIGPQTQFLETAADIAIFGGAAGSGKSHALLLEPLRHFNDSDIGIVIFRRTTKQVRNEGGLWDSALKLYSELGADFKSSSLECIFKSGMKIKFAHLEHDKDVYNWQGSQIPIIGYDELTHFSERQFWYLLSRNRSMTGVPGYIRATCNADADSWVRQFIDWWINPDTGYPIQQRAAALRYFVRIDDKLHWGDSADELIQKFGIESMPKSVTFIPAKLEDNPILMHKDPTYQANLNALPLVERMRLKEGNWNVKAAAGMVFKREWFEIVDTLPSTINQIRYWDRAATEVSSKNKDPDWTVGLKLIRDHHGLFYIADVCRMQASPHKVEQSILNCAKQDGLQCQVHLEQDPGQAGVVEVKHYSKLLAGYNVRFTKVTVDKKTRARGASAQAEAGNIKILRALWNEDLLKELASFPESKHDDMVDALSGAINTVIGSQTGEFTDSMINETPSIAESPLELEW